MNKSPSPRKLASRKRLLQSAARLFRRHGYAGAGIDEICAEAGLTRGAFYSHFPDKATLFAEAVGHEHDFVTFLRNRSGSGSARLSEQAKKIASAYLAPENRSKVFAGCTLAALSSEVARNGAAGQQAYAQALAELIDEFERGLDFAEHARAHAVLAAVLCVGGLVVASGCGSHALSNEVSRACTEAVQQLLHGNGLSGQLTGGGVTDVLA